MPTLLHIETATVVCSAAISRDGKLLATSEQLAWYRQRRPDPAK